MTIIHITNRQTWEESQDIGIYQADTLESEGFIHCCQPEQVVGVLEKWFHGEKDLVLLEIDPEKTGSRFVYENLEGGEELFPHIYGPINLDAVLSVKFI